jgi:hypothetical protein
MPKQKITWRSKTGREALILTFSLREKGPPLALGEFSLRKKALSLALGKFSRRKKGPPLPLLSHWERRTRCASEGRGAGMGEGWGEGNSIFENDRGRRDTPRRLTSNETPCHFIPAVECIS